MNDSNFTNNDRLQSVIEHYTRCVLNREIQLDQIRPELKVLGMDESNIKKVVASVDDNIQNYDLQRVTENRSFKFASSGFGIIISLIGIILVFFDSIGVKDAIDLDFGGYSLIFVGLAALFIKKVKARTGKFHKDKFGNME